MKVLRNTIYRDMCSILCSDKQDMRTAQIIVLLSRVLTVFPSKSPYCLTANRIISFYEKNIYSIDLILEVMKEEGEDEEVIKIINMLHNAPTITTKAECLRLCNVLADYVKYSSILKESTSFIKTLDILNVGDEPANIHETIDALYKMSQKIITVYNTVNVNNVSHTFDSSDKDGMKMVISEAKELRATDKCIITGVRGLNSLLSPGYLAGCVYIFAALPGCYKSGILLKSHVDTLKYNSHIKNTTNDKTPISMYISMENTMTQTVRRLWGLLFPTADMSAYSVDDIVEMIDSELKVNDMRSVLLYYGYREKSTADLRTIISSYNDDENVVVALYLDYIKRIRPGRNDSVTSSSEKAELHAIMNELKLIASDYKIPIVSGHQLNREAAKQVDEMVQRGGYNKTDQAMGRANLSVAWEVIEVADFVAVMNIENNGENKVLVVRAVKQRDLDNSTDNSIIGIRHPFISPQSFALKDDIVENVTISLPIFLMLNKTNYMAKIQ